ncbi:type II toxin-antitoxin system VapB family antitoxin [Benzoatithermus flavus]|uniref:Type II toxin-antitoxin system VapB family antitoxin n=1 Tax=Benzoatithermus flavus TaxID=3108223 RepID=A0ABU8XZS1_9PROT
MAILIESDEAEALLKEIDSAEGTAIGERVLELARQEVARLRRTSRSDCAERLQRLEEISRLAAAKIPKDALSPDEIIGCDE